MARIERTVAWAGLPGWVEPPLTEPGSIDPLGYQAEADRIAEKLLPGITVFTRRARYLSFPCWAIRETDDGPDEIDAWEVALSVGEHFHHSHDDDEHRKCSYLGMRLLRQRELGGHLRRGDNLPKRLHRQPARVLYAGLLRSCGLVFESGPHDSRRDLTDLGKKLATEFSRRMPAIRPKTIGGCDGRFPCLSMIGNRERRWLREALLDYTDEAHQRRATFKHVGIARWHGLRGDAAPVLRQWPRRPAGAPQDIERAIRQAAVLELTALPLTVLFRHLYWHHAGLNGRFPQTASFRTYRVRPEPPELLADVGAHLLKARELGGERVPLDLRQLKAHVYDKHRNAKRDAPWVDNSWRVLRPGIASKRDPTVHGYRLDAFASLLRDIGSIR